MTFLTSMFWKRSQTSRALRGVLDVGLGVRDVRVELLAQVLLLLAVLVGELLDVDVEGAGPEVVVVGESGLLAGLEVLEPALQRLVELLDALLLLGLVGVDDLLDLLLELGGVLLPGPSSTQVTIEAAK